MHCPSVQQEFELLQFDVAPITTDDCITDVLRGLSLAIELIGKQGLFEADRAAGAVIIDMTVQKTAVAKTGITIAITGLLCEHFRNIPGNAVGKRNVWC